MKPFFMNASTNFGDHINSWLWPRLIPELLAREDDVRLIGIGSLLKADVALIAGRKVVFGAGSGYGDLPSPGEVARWQVYAVRGPLTAETFGFDPGTAITDGAWLINQLEEYVRLPEKNGPTVFVPHWTSAVYGNWRPATEAAGVTLVDPLDDCVQVMDQIARAPLVLAESLHAAIFADYFRTPWIPVTTAGRVLHFKWLDWAQSLDVPYRPLPLPPSDWIDFLTQGQRPVQALPNAEPQHFTPEMFPYHSVAKELKASTRYRLTQRAKGVARGMRDTGLTWLQRHRNPVGSRRWTERRNDALAEYLAGIAARAETLACLSADAMRARRIDQLNSALDRMRRDWA